MCGRDREWEIPEEVSECWGTIFPLGCDTSTFRMAKAIQITQIETSKMHIGSHSACSIHRAFRLILHLLSFAMCCAPPAMSIILYILLWYFIHFTFINAWYWYATLHWGIWMHWLKRNLLFIPRKCLSQEPNFFPHSSNYSVYLWKSIDCNAILAL